jgi:hypothetical protein
VSATSDRFDRQGGLCAQARCDRQLDRIAFAPPNQAGFLPTQPAQFFANQPFGFGIAQLSPFAFSSASTTVAQPSRGSSWRKAGCSRALARVWSRNASRSRFSNSKVVSQVVQTGKSNFETLIHSLHIIQTI